MRKKEDMECFKWHKNDRTCWLCEHEEECRYEFALYNYADALYIKCQHKESFPDSYIPKCERSDRDGKYCARSDHRVVYECHAKDNGNVN